MPFALDDKSAADPADDDAAGGERTSVSLGEMTDARASQRPVPESSGQTEDASPEQGAEEAAAVDNIEPADTAAIAVSDSLPSDTMRVADKEARRRMIKEQAERDKAAAKLRRDSIAKIKHDTIVARRLAKMAEQRRKDEAKAARIKLEQERRRRLRIDKAKAKAARKGVEYTGEEYATDTLPADSLAADSLAADSLRAGQMPDTLARDSMSLDSLSADTLDMEGAIADSIPADSVYRQIKAYRNVKMYRTDSQMICDSLVTMNTDSIIHLYIDPILWNETNQVTSDYMDIYTANQMIVRAEFIDRPIMAAQIDTVRYNQVKGKKMIAYFRDGKVYRNDVNGNAQTIYYLQEDENSDQVQGLMYIESADVTFYLDSGKIDKITYRDHPEYVVYPMDKIPETQLLKLPDFDWFDVRRPTRDEVFDRRIRPSRRGDAESRRRPTFPITERIDRYRRFLMDNRRWVDRLDRLTPEIVEWRNSRRRK